MSDLDDSKEKIKKDNVFIKDLIETGVYFLVSLIIVTIIHMFVGTLVNISGESMTDTFQDKDKVVLEKITYYFSDPKRYDVIVFTPYKDEPKNRYIKRVIGLPGEKIQIKDNKIYINGKIIEDKHMKDTMNNGGIAEEEITLDDDEYFVLGDNRNGSTDSRFLPEKLTKKRILGKVVFRVWPIKSFGPIKN